MTVKAAPSTLRPPRAVRRYVRQATPCPYGGKNSYRTKRKARRVAEGLRNLNGTILHVYRCPNCKLWHPTSTAQPKKQAAA